MRKPTKIKNSKTLIVVSILILLAATAYMFLKQSDSNLPSDETIIIGTVSFYGDKYNSTDGPVILTVSGKEIDTGGGLRASSIYGSIDNNAKKIGQRVKARVRVESTHGRESYTLYNCSDCYIKAL